MSATYEYTGKKIVRTKLEHSSEDLEREINSLTDTLQNFTVRLSAFEEAQKAKAVATGDAKTEVESKEIEALRSAMLPLNQRLVDLTAQLNEQKAKAKAMVFSAGGSATQSTSTGAAGESKGDTKGLSETKAAVETRQVKKSALLSSIPGIEKYLDPKVYDLNTTVNILKKLNSREVTNPLQYAVTNEFNGSEVLTELLLQHGADPNLARLEYEGNTNMTLLMEAITNAKLYWLIDLTGTPGQKNRDRADKKVELLLQHTNDFTLKDSFGYMVLDYCMFQSYFFMPEYQEKMKKERAADSMKFNNLVNTMHFSQELYNVLIDKLYAPLVKDNPKIRELPEEYVKQYSKDFGALCKMQKVMLLNEFLTLAEHYQNAPEDTQQQQYSYKGLDGSQSFSMTCTSAPRRRKR